MLYFFDLFKIMDEPQSFVCTFTPSPQQCFCVKNSDLPRYHIPLPTNSDTHGGCGGFGGCGGCGGIGGIGGCGGQGSIGIYFVTVWSLFFSIICISFTRPIRFAALSLNFSSRQSCEFGSIVFIAYFIFSLSASISFAKAVSSIAIEAIIAFIACSLSGIVSGVGNFGIDIGLI